MRQHRIIVVDIPIPKEEDGRKRGITGPK